MSTTALDTYFKSLPILCQERMNFIFVFLKSPWKEYADLQLWWIYLCILIKPISCEMRCSRKYIECSTNNQQPCISSNFYWKSIRIIIKKWQKISKTKINWKQPDILWYYVPRMMHALRSFILATFLRAAPGSPPPPPPPPPSSSARGAASPSAWDPPSTVLPFSVLLQGQ